MDTKILYRVITYEGKSSEEIDNLINTFLRDEAEITAINISHSAVQMKEEDKEYILYSAMLLYSFKD